MVRRIDRRRFDQVTVDRDAGHQGTAKAVAARDLIAVHAIFATGTEVARDYLISAHRNSSTWQVICFSAAARPH